MDEDRVLSGVVAAGWLLGREREGKEGICAVLVRILLILVYYYEKKTFPHCCYFISLLRNEEFSSCGVRRILSVFYYYYTYTQVILFLTLNKCFSTILLYNGLLSTFLTVIGYT